MHITTLREELESLPESRRKKVEETADALIAEEMTLRDLRKARNQTQARVAARLGINQENVSRLEQRSDLLISTLSGYVEAMGGKLNLVAVAGSHRQLRRGRSRSMDEGEARVPCPAVRAGAGDSRRRQGDRPRQSARVPDAERQGDLRFDAAQDAPVPPDRGRAAWFPVVVPGLGGGGDRPSA